MGKLEVAPAGLRLRAVRDGPAKPLKETAGVVVDKAEEGVEEIVKGAKLLLWTDLPEWQREGNHYIETGYRPSTVSLWACLHSWTYLHNETVNIFSHLLGAVLFLLLPLYIFNTSIPPRYAVATPADILACSTYFLGVAACFTFSTIFHTIFHHTPRAYALGLALDFQGVILLMWGANIPLIYYAFPCEPRLQRLYWCLTTAFAVLCSLATFQPRFRDPHLRPLRAATFGALALTTFFPVAHGLLRYGYEVQSERIALRWIVATLVLNTAGAGAYAVKFPERWYPRRFDLFGASHQIMHVMILVAGGAYGMAVLREFDYRHGEAVQCAGFGRGW